MTCSLLEHIARVKEATESVLDKLVPKATVSPAKLHQAMRHSLFSNGKMIRPALVILGTESVGGRLEDAIYYGAAIELIHTYTLVHDDLPSLDNDDYRRGKPSLHKQFDESTAILAGNALLTLAGQTLVRKELFGRATASVVAKNAEELFDGIGSRGTIGGQVVDLEIEDGGGDLKIVEGVYTNKTGKLIALSLTGGARLGGATDQQIELLSLYGHKVGLAFQVVDDILDLLDDNKGKGANRKSDLANKKSTYPALIGVESSKQIVNNLRDEAIELISSMEIDSRLLIDMANFIVDRRF
ncbi:MAG: polyprenyl synthetase family protein [Nitrospinota bacterium]